MEMQTTKRKALTNANVGAMGNAVVHHLHLASLPERTNQYSQTRSEHRTTREQTEYLYIPDILREPRQSEKREQKHHNNIHEHRIFSLHGFLLFSLHYS